MSSHQHPTNTNVAEIYKSVIADVINQMKESFLDENIDVDVLNQFKKEWEEKVQQSGCVEFEQRQAVPPHPVRGVMPSTSLGGGRGHVQIGGAARQQMQAQIHAQQQASANVAHQQAQQTHQITQLVQHPPQLQQSLNQAVHASHLIDSLSHQSLQSQQQHLQQQQPQQQSIQLTTQPRAGLTMQMAYLQQGQAQLQVHQNALQQQMISNQVQAHQLQQQIGQQLQPHIQVTSQAGIPFHLTTTQGVRMVQSIQPTPQQQQQQQQFIIQTVAAPQLTHGQFIMLPNGQQIPVNMNLNGARIVAQNPAMHQVDGNGAIDATEGEELELAKEEEPSSSRAVSERLTRRGKPTKKEAKKIAAALIHQMQTDGGGETMTDSSSEEDEVEEEEDSLRRYADTVGNGQVPEDEGDQDENPLNSDDDQSTDDEDLTTLFDAENVVMCQFEKVHRARNKWKFQLKDGIMHVENKDYCFQKCTGEAEW